MKICDLHSHVLPGADDGAPTIHYALQMLQNAVASDVQVLAVTPHCNNGPYENYLTPALTEQFLQLQQAAKDIAVQLVPGAEVRVDAQLPALLSDRKIPTLNAGRYLLTEFCTDTKPESFTDALQNICALGYIPLVAHPERYTAVCNAPQIVASWLDMGCHLQLTGGSITGQYGKTVARTAGYLLRQDFVACIASDAHGLHNRSNFLLDVYDHLCVQDSEQYARCMLYENPMRICSDDDL